MKQKADPRPESDPHDVPWLVIILVVILGIAGILSLAPLYEMAFNHAWVISQATN